jgi:hypothetical protein
MHVDLSRAPGYAGGSCLQLDAEPLMPVASGCAQTGEKTASMLRLPGPPAGPPSLHLHLRPRGRPRVRASAHGVAGQAGPACPLRLLAWASASPGPGRGPRQAATARRDSTRQRAPQAEQGLARLLATVRLDPARPPSRPRPPHKEAQLQSDLNRITLAGPGPEAGVASLALHWHSADH